MLTEVDVTWTTAGFYIHSWVEFGKSQVRWCPTIGVLPLHPKTSTTCGWEKWLLLPSRFSIQTFGVFLCLAYLIGYLVTWGISHIKTCFSHVAKVGNSIPFFSSKKTEQKRRTAAECEPLVLVKLFTVCLFKWCYLYIYSGTSQQWTRLFSHVSMEPVAPHVLLDFSRVLIVSQSVAVFIENKKVDK